MKISKRKTYRVWSPLQTVKCLECLKCSLFCTSAPRRFCNPSITTHYRWYTHFLVRIPRATSLQKTVSCPFKNSYDGWRWGWMVGVTHLGCLLRYRMLAKLFKLLLNRLLFCQPGVIDSATRSAVSSQAGKTLCAVSTTLATLAGFPSSCFGTFSGREGGVSKQLVWKPENLKISPKKKNNKGFYG